jgi:hypothetical protein
MALSNNQGKSWLGDKVVNHLSHRTPGRGPSHAVSCIFLGLCFCDQLALVRIREELWIFWQSGHWEPVADIYWVEYPHLPRYILCCEGLFSKGYEMKKNLIRRTLDSLRQTAWQKKADVAIKVLAVFEIHLNPDGRVLGPIGIECYNSHTKSLLHFISKLFTSNLGFFIAPFRPTFLSLEHLD